MTIFGLICFNGVTMINKANRATLLARPPTCTISKSLNDSKTLADSNSIYCKISIIALLYCVVGDFSIRCVSNLL